MDMFVIVIVFSRYFCIQDGQDRAATKRMGDRALRKFNRNWSPPEHRHPVHGSRRLSPPLTRVPDRQSPRRSASRVTIPRCVTECVLPGHRCGARQLRTSNYLAQSRCLRKPQLRSECGKRDLDKLLEDRTRSIAPWYSRSTRPAELGRESAAL